MNDHIFRTIELFLLTFFILLNSWYIFLLTLTIPVLYRRFLEIKSKTLYHLLPFDIVPPVSIIITAYNEKDIAIASIESALQTKLLHFEVIFVDDGSTDHTLQLLTDTYQLIPVPPAIPFSLHTAPIKNYFRSKLYPNLLIIQKENGGREDAVNAGINACITPFFTNIDSDTFIEPDGIHRLIQHVLTIHNICGLGGTLGVANGCTIENGTIKKIDFPASFLGKMQVLEYLKTFSFGRLGWNLLGGSFLISGGFGLFNKQAVLQVGGLKKVLAGDLNLTLDLHLIMHDLKVPYKIEYVFDSVAWTDVPQTYSALAKQRIRWQSSIIDVCWRYKHMLFNPKYGTIGFFQVPYMLLGEGLSALVEGFGYLYALFCFFYGILNFTFFWYFLLIAWGVSIFLSLASIVLEEVFWKRYISLKHIGTLVFLALMENFGYRQLNVWWRIRGFFRFFTKKRFAREELNRLNPK